ncbi:MAG: adenylate/guanylate cyclase domain-containing protein [Spirochaetota bacterium]
MRKKKGIRFSIGFKLIFIISIIITTSLSGIIWLATYYFKADNVRRAEQITLDRASLISLKVKTDFNALIDNSELLLESYASDSADINFRDEDILYIAEIKQSASDSMQTVKRLQNLPSLARIGNPDIDLDEIIASENELVRNSFNTDVNVFNSSLYFNEPVIGISSPYNIQSPGSADSVMLVFVSMNRFLEAVKSQSIYKSFIVNGRGDLIAHFDAGLVKAKANMIDMPIVQQMLKSTVDNGKYDFTTEEGEKFLGSYKKTGFSDIGVVTIVEEDVAFAAVYRLQRRNILLTVIVINVAIFILFLFSKSITRPIRRLAAAAERIKEGDFNVRVKRTTRDEIGDLSESFTEMAQGLAEREKMKDAFGKFVNKEIAEQVLKGEIKLGGERKYAAVFFSDIRSFTAISEKLEPEEVVEFLNEYMTLMVDCVNKTYGVVDKYIGDAIMAIWGAPLSKGNDAENAINGALLMRQVLIAYNKGRGGDKKPIIRIGCGINIGPMIAGQIGSEEKMEYTVIGDTVNLASRIESLNKPFGTDILISEEAFQKTCGIYKVTPMQKIKVKGKEAPQQIYAVISRVDDPNGYSNLQEVRNALGIEMKGMPSGDVEEKEQKFEILEEKTTMPDQTKSNKKDVKYEVLD